MSYLAATSFDDSFTTTDIGLRVTEPLMAKGMRIKMLKHGVIADGTLTLEVKDPVNGNILSTVNVTAQDFNNIGATYAHGYIYFEFDEQVGVNLKPSTQFKDLVLTLTMSNHTEDPNNYIALVRQFENPFVEEFGSRPPSVSPEDDGWFNPYGIEIYGIRR